MKIYFASDHAGFELKNALIDFVQDELGYEVEDCGAYAQKADDDYPDFIRRAAVKVQGDLTSRGIVLGGSGQGEAMMANRFPHVRAAVYYGGPLEIIKLSRAHNDANVLSLGARFLSFGEAEEAVRLWLETPFGNDERHIRRIKKVDE